MATVAEFDLMTQDKEYQDYIKILEAILNKQLNFGGTREDLYQQCKNLDLNFKVLSTLKVSSITTTTLNDLIEKKRRNLRALDRLRKGDDPGYDSEDEYM